MGTMNMFVLTTLCIVAWCAQFDPMLRIDSCVSIHELRWDISGRLPPLDPKWFLDLKLDVKPFSSSVGSGSLGRFGASKNLLLRGRSEATWCCCRFLPYGEFQAPVFFGREVNVRSGEQSPYRLVGSLDNLDHIGLG